MRLTKLGHCCLLIEENSVRLLTDPGSYSTLQTTVKDINIILITHEHQDHIHIPSLKEVIKNNPKAKIVTNSSVAKILDAEKIVCEILEKGAKTIEGISIEALGELHAEIHSSIPRTKNTGYLINNKLFYPGDALTNPKREVPILALPVAGPWLKISEAIDYAIELNPKLCFPVHDGMLQSDKMGPVHRLPERLLKEKGIKFILIEINKKTEV